jgi:hypothetical protein
LFKVKDAPEYAPGFIACVSTSCAAACLSMVYRFYCIWENKRRDKTGTAEAFDHAYEDDLTDRKVRMNPTVTLNVQKLIECRIRNSDTSTEVRRPNIVLSK